MKPRSVIITGGGYGLGRATALQLAAAGWHTIIVDRDADRAAETHRTVLDNQGTGSVVVGDVTQGETFERALEAASQHAPLGGLVTCAALRHAGGITQISEADWLNTLNVILNGVFQACRHVIPELIRQGGGSIVNVSSPDGFGRPNMVAYASAKAAVNTLSRCLALDHMKDGIRVNVVLPGFMHSGMTEHYDSQRIAATMAQAVARRPGEPQEYAQLIGFLMSDAAASFTGGLYGSTLAGMP